MRFQAMRDSSLKKFSQTIKPTTSVKMNNNITKVLDKNDFMIIELTENPPPNKIKRLYERTT